MSGVCSECGCTEERPCVDLITGEPCYWADEEQTICSACAYPQEADPPLVELLSEGEAAMYIRAMRASGSGNG